MKKVDDILEEYDYKCYKGNSHKELFSIREVRELIKLAQEDAIRGTVEECAKSAEIEERDYRHNPTKISNYGEEVCSEWEGIYYGVDKQSILSVADKLIKEL